MNAKKAKRVALYCRVSTDGQTTKNQERELEAVAERHGWSVVAVFKDQGISGAKGRDKRPGLDKLLQAVSRKEFDLVAAWSVDRLGRSLLDLVQVLQELHGKSIDLYLHQQGIDTTTPSGKAMFQMMGVFAEFERSIIHERVMAGLARARSEGIHLGRRPTVTNDTAKVRAIQSDHKAGKSLREIAKAHGVRPLDRRTANSWRLMNGTTRTGEMPPQNAPAGSAVAPGAVPQATGRWLP